jgi:hypothetical protein
VAEAVAVLVSVLVGVLVAVLITFVVAVGVKDGRGVAVLDAWGVEVGWRVLVLVAQGIPASQVGVTEAHWPFEPTQIVAVAEAVEVGCGVLVLVGQGMPASHVGVGEAHWPLEHAVAVGVTVMQWPGSQVGVAVSLSQPVPASQVGVGDSLSQAVPGSQVGVAVAWSHTWPGSQVAVALGEAQSPCPVVSTQTVAVAEGHPTAGFGQSVAVAVAVRAQGSCEHAVSVGEAHTTPAGHVGVGLKLPFGPTPFAGSADTRLPWVDMPAATATVLSNAMSITLPSTKAGKNRLLLLWTRLLLFIFRPSFALPANEDTRGSKITATN